MSNYTKTTDFEAKDSLPSGDSGKIIRGSEFETEFDNIATAIASKSDANNPTFTGTVTIDGLTVNGNTVLGNAASDTVTVTADIASNLLPSADDTYNLGAVGAEWNDLFIDGTANIDSLVADTADINGGTIDGVTIGGSSAGAITGTTITGTSFASTGDMTFGDNDKAVFGAGSDLQIYHDGLNSYVTDAGTGDLRLSANNLRMQNADNTANYIKANNGSNVELFFNNAAKLATSSSGIDVTGVITTDGMTTSADINFGDNDKAVFGAGSDLQIYHDGGNSYIRDNGSGNLRITSDSQVFIAKHNSENMLRATADGSVDLYYDNATKLATTSTGIDVTGTVTADGLTVYKSGSGDAEVVIRPSDSSGDPVLKLKENSASTRLTIRSDESDGAKVKFQTGNTEVTRLAFGQSGDISFYEDTGTTAKLFWDASAESLGIGTSSPSSALEVSEGGGGNTVARFTNSAQANSFIQFNDTASTVRPRIGSAGNNLILDTANTERMRIDSDGRVGIGTDSPTRALDVSKAGSTILANFKNTAGTSSFITFGNTTSTADQIRAGSNGTAFTISTNYAERMRLDASGNLLVGKTSGSFGTAGSALYPTGLTQHTRDGASVLQLNRLSSDGVIQTFNKDGSTVGSIGTVSGDLAIGSGDTALRFNSGGDTILPATTTGPASRDNAVSLGNSIARFKDLYMSNHSYVGANGTSPTTGGVFVGGDSVGRLVTSHATGTVSGNWYHAFKYDTNVIGSITQSGTGSVAYNTSSDQRLKENIVDAPSASDDIDAIQVRSFDWKADGSHQKYGMVAQELLTVAPDAVSQGLTEEDMMGVDYSKLVPMLVKEIQSLRARVAQLETN